MISHYSVERIPDGDLCRVSTSVLYLNNDGEWESVLLASINGPRIPDAGRVRLAPMFPTCFDLHPTIDDFVRGKIQELDESEDQVSLVFRYRGNWCYGVGYSKETSGKPMTLSEFYVEISRIM